MEQGRLLHSRVEVTRNSEGTVTKLRGVSRDITEEKQIADQLRESEKRFRRVVDHVGDVLLIDDVEGRVIFANDRFFDLFGFRREQLSSLRLEDLVAPEHRVEVRDRHDRRMRGESVATHLEHQGVRADGSRIWLDIDVVPIVDQTGKITGTQSAMRDVTERKRTERALLESEQKFRRVVEHIGDALLVYDVEGRAVFANDRFFELFGYCRRQLSSLQIEDLVVPEYRAELGDRHNRRMRGESAPANFELEGIRLDGSRLWLEVGVVPTVDQEGKITGAQSVMRDITERKHAQRVIHDSEERLRHLIESSNDWVYEMGREGRYTYAGPQCRELLGYEPEELLGKRPTDFMQADEAHRVAPIMQKCLEEQKSFSGLRTARVRKDGTLLVWESNGVPVFDRSGEFRGFRGTVRDITERHRAEMELRESEERLRHLITSSSDWIWEIDTNATFTYASPQCRDILGYEPEELIGRTPFDLMDPDEAVRVSTILNSLATEQKPFRNLRNVKRHKEGHLVVFEATAVPILGADGTFHGYRGMARDITERDRAEHALRESEERFRFVANTAPVMIWMSDINDQCTYFNKTWLDFTGRTVSQELGRGWQESIHPDDLGLFIGAAADAMKTKSTTELQYRMRRHDGQYRWVLDFGVPRFNPDGSFDGYIGSCIDITERKQAEETMATIGRRLIEAHEEERTWIGRELHDDINQRLALLSVELDRWLKDHPSRAPIRELIQHAQQRITELSIDVQSLSHRLHSSKLEYLGLVKAANSFCRELSRQSGVEVAFAHDGVPRTLPKEISLCVFRVLQEALQNAVKYSGVKSFTVDLRGSSDSIELTVTDTGLGFDPVEALNHKGLGLISMRERLQMVRGELSVQSRTGTGTTIHARVPLENVERQAMAG